jgi:deoxyribodipyrimidine photolyase-like uncharacterized protein
VRLMYLEIGDKAGAENHLQSNRVLIGLLWKSTPKLHPTQLTLPQMLHRLYTPYLFLVSQIDMANRRL